ncbi:MAG: hypothetical protein RSD64_02095 [Christensenellaceae bacterium]
MRKHKGRTTIRRPMGVRRVKFSNAVPAIKFIILIAGVAIGVLAMIFFGFPLIEDLVKGVDPSLRYQPKIEANFELNENFVVEKNSEASEIFIEDMDFKVNVKNEPYIDGQNIIFTTRKERKNSFQLDAVVLYHTADKTARVLPNVEKKYDNLLSPVLSGNLAVWIDSMTNGGGRIVGYDIEKEEQFVIKEYAYAMPALSISGNYLAFMQWAGDTTQRLYVYDVAKREATTVKLYETTVGNSAVDISPYDMVWAEYNKDGEGVLKRVAFGEEESKYDNYDFGKQVYEPKTNGKDIVFATSKDVISGNLMLSTDGGPPVLIAENVVNYNIGDGFVAYTKDNRIHIAYAKANKQVMLTSDITKNLLASVVGNGVCYYDVTDASVADEIVMYTTIDELTGEE